MTALFTNRSLGGGIDQIPLPSACPGELWLCGKHVIGVDVEATLAFTGANHVACLTQRHELLDRYPDYVSWLDSNQPARATWAATPDLGTLSADESLQLYRTLTNSVQAGAKLIVHCAAGIGRSGTVAVAILMLLGFEIGEAEDIVAAHRPMAGPETGPQRDLLENLAIELSIPLDSVLFTADPTPLERLWFAQTRNDSDSATLNRKVAGNTPVVRVQRGRIGTQKQNEPAPKDRLVQKRNNSTAQDAQPMQCD